MNAFRSFGRRALPLALFGAVCLTGNATADTTYYDHTGAALEVVPQVGYGPGVVQYWDRNGVDGANGKDCTKDHNGDTTEGGDGTDAIADYFSFWASGNQTGSLTAVTANGGSGGDGGSNTLDNGSSKCEQGSKKGRPGGDGGDGKGIQLAVYAGTSGTTYQTGNTAIIVQSLGGDGGEGGDSYKNTSENWGKTGDGGNAGGGGDARVYNYAHLDVRGTPQVYTEVTTSDSGTTTRGMVINNAHGIVVQSGGGIGGEGGENPTNNGHGSAGGIAGNGGPSRIYNYANVTTNGGSALVAQSIGGMGGDAGLNKKGKGGAGGNGGDGGSSKWTYNVDILNTGRLTVNREVLPACSVEQGITSNCRVTEQNASQISQFSGYCDERVDTCEAIGAYGIFAQSVGGGGGDAGAAGGSKALGADGGDAGFGHIVNVKNQGDIALHTQGSTGIFAQSVGGGGGTGGMAHARGSNAIAIGGSGGDGGYGGVVKVNNSGNICTGGACNVALADLTEDSDAVGGAAGIFAQSVGGGGGDGGSAKAKSTGSFFGLVGGKALAIGGSGGDGGNGMGVTVANSGSIATAEVNAPGIFAQSVGGGGGNGAGAVAFDLSLLTGGNAVALGGSGGGGGGGSRVAVNCAAYSDPAKAAGACQDASWQVTTPSQTLTQAYNPDWLGSNDNNQHVIATAGLASAAIFAQSVGGGGGSGGYAVAAAGAVTGNSLAFAHGGSGGSGGSGGAVYAGTNGMRLYTLGDSAPGVVAQSIGGGGGAGGYAVSLSADLIGQPMSLALGGSGGNGGSAGQVIVDNPGGLITTQGDYSHGIQAQSIGGGGGSGGMALSGAVSLVNSSLALAVGGSGGNGGKGGEVYVYNRNAAALGTGGAGNADITTTGFGASAILAQSIGGGGGNGGVSVAGSVSLTDVAVSVAVGGAGGSGNQGQTAFVENWGNLTTLGGGAAAISAQSIGGGGGNGGFAASGSVALKGNGSLALGGSGGSGGVAGRVEVQNHGHIFVTADNAPAAYVPQVPDSSLNQALEAWVALGFDDASASPAVLALYNLITGQANPRLAATQTNAPGILAQSIGGAGGAGGFATAAGVAGGVSFDVAIGGSGGSGGHAGEVLVNNSGRIIVQGAQSAGVAAMSIGGNGGLGGFAASAGLALGTVSTSVGGNGGQGGVAGKVNVNTSNADGQQPVMTQGNMSPALLALSIGGNGGVGGFDAAVSLGELGAAAVSVGGNGGNGGVAGDVSVTSEQYLTTSGLLSPGVVAMSLGGSGGMGGMTASVAQSMVGNLSTAVGGGGGDGGRAGQVSVTTRAPVVTYGNLSSGIVAQSVGGAGGMGGTAVSSAVLTDVLGESVPYKVNIGGAVGGDGGSGGQANTVSVNSEGLIQTYGFLSHAIVAQSIGGSGGNGGMAIDGSIDLTAPDSPVPEGEDDGGDEEEEPETYNVNFGVAVGGSGGNGGNGSSTQVVHNGSLVTGYGVVESGQPGGAFLSSGILAQSIGGSGGSGGSVLAMAAGNTPNHASVAVGGKGGPGGDAGAVSVASNRECDSNQGCGQGIMTAGAGSAAIKAQAIGGGGGSGGSAIAAATASSASGALGIGGAGGDGGDGGTVDVQVGGSLITLGVHSPGVLAQSVGGGGGDGGVSISSVYEQGAVLKKALALFGVDMEQVEAVMDTVNTVYSAADTASTVYDMANGDWQPEIDGAGSLAVGGDGGDGGDGKTVTVASTARIVTGAAGLGHHSSGILAQSVGGGGGNGGLASTSQTGSVTASLRLGGDGGVGGNGGSVTVSASNQILTTGAQSSAIVAQSIGGGGGSGGQTFDRTEAIGAFSLGLGGDGGAGGAGGQVSVDNLATLITNGLHAAGIVAQSIGGGGGNASGSLLGGLGDHLPATVTAAATARTGAVDINNLLESGAQVGLLDGGRAGQSGTDAGAAFAIGIGGAGGSGGNGGQVSITNSGTIFTGAEVDDSGQIVASGTPLRTAHSAAIFAQSVGGGGGASNASSVDANAGKSSVAVAVGGASDGSESVHRAGTVTVRNTGSLVTYGVNAVGIHAQSVGAGGGVSNTFNGLSGTLAGLSGAAAHALQVGGTMRGNGAMVKVCDKLNDDGACQTSDKGQVILTHGAGSHGILAQSIGGGGGSAVAFSSALTEAIADDVVSGDFDLSVDGSTIVAAATRGVAVGVNLGGTAGSGGDRYGERVRVFTAADISTQGTGAMGVLAQSVGGGGGLAASHVLNASSGDHRLEAALGAAMNGPLATGGNVAVELRGDVLTEGDLAHGVVAQTVGGGGGVLQASSHTAASDGLNVMDILLGAQGGANNSANNGTDTLSVTLTRAVQTRGDGALGVLAQSVGAGGGLAASHTASASHGAVQAGLRLGGEGVNGGGGGVTLSYGSSVSTEGANAVGLLAQSVGSGGGVALVSHDSRVEVGDISVDMALGYHHANEEGASGSTVTVSNAVGTVVTRGDNASGLVMQSVAGGGTSLFASSAVAQGNDISAGFQLGGVGSTGSGQSVTATLGTLGQASVIATEGRNAFGLVAQSIGGGGGLAALAVAAREDDVPTPGQLTGQAYLGMAGQTLGSGHYGSLVDLTLADVAIQTTGLNSVGLVAQSIGGGGGIAAAVAGSDSLFQGSLRLGASGGGASGSGAGGGVTVDLLASRVGGDTPTSLISTAAHLTPALLAQSIGGGGGYSAMQVSDLILGSNAGSQAADVTVNNSATLITTGTSAIGLVAQSIGGGGGLGYTSGSASLGGAPSGANGKAVTVRQDGDLFTYGDYAHGILAQSVGGGGGTVMSNGSAVNATVHSGTGHAGNVNVYVNGNLATYGKGAHGVVAQSAAGGGGLVQDGDELVALYGGGGGKPGVVNVFVNGSISVSGAGAHGIYATASDDPLVEVGEGASVVGGQGGSAVYFQAGRNELRNRGLLATADGALGLVIHSLDGDTRLYNEAGGTLFGSVRLHQDGANRLHNAFGGTVLAGAEINLGTGGLLRNEGQLGLASEHPGVVTVTGNLIQGESGSLALRFDQQSGAADQIHVTGTAELAGVITPLLVNAEHIRPGTRATSIFSADGELDLAGLRVLDSALLHHTLTEENGEITVTTTADFTPTGLRGDGERLGTVLAGLQSDGGTRLSRGITALLAQLPDVQALGDAYDTVASGGISAVPMMSLQNASLVMDTVTARLDGWRADDLASGARVQSLTQGDEVSGPRGWLSLVGNTSNGQGLGRDATAMVLGADMALGERTLVGASVSASRLQFDLDRPNAWATGDEFGLSLYGLHRAGNAYASAMLFAASNRVTYHSSLRGYGYDLAGETTFDNRTLGGRLEAGYAFTLPSRRVTLTPFVAVQPTQVYQDDAREVYNAELGIGVNFRDAVIESLPADLGVQIGSHWTLAGGARLSSFARLAWRHDFEPERNIQRDFHGIRLRDSSLPEAEDTAIARLGMQYSLGRALSVTGEVEGQWSSPYDTVGGSIGLQYRW